MGVSVQGLETNYYGSKNIFRDQKQFPGIKNNFQGSTNIFWELK